MEVAGASPFRDQMNTRSAEYSKDAAPGDDLGANIKHPALPPLTFATKSRVWGDQSGAAREPTVSAFLAPGFKHAVLARDAWRCHFCGFASHHNEVHSLNDNHNDVRVENLQAADPLCHGWQHLGELARGDAAVAYLPGLSPQDINHLQRTIMVALASDDAAARADARTLLNWLASHRDYAARAWGTHDPAVFADALVRQPENERDFREIAFDGLGIVFHPRFAAGALAAWLGEAYAPCPTTGWGQVYHDIMHAPL
ncbi:intracellular multiplication protein IcmJ [Oxalobacteraceae bacterium GrIS 1.11]